MEYKNPCWANHILHYLILRCTHISEYTFFPLRHIVVWLASPYRHHQRQQPVQTRQSQKNTMGKVRKRRNGEQLSGWTRTVNISLLLTDWLPAKHFCRPVMAHGCVSGGLLLAGVKQVLSTVSTSYYHVEAPSSSSFRDTRPREWRWRQLLRPRWRWWGTRAELEEVTVASLHLPLQHQVVGGTLSVIISPSVWCHNTLFTPQNTPADKWHERRVCLRAK